MRLVEHFIDFCNKVYIVNNTGLQLLDSIKIASKSRFHHMYIYLLYDVASGSDITPCN